MVFEAPSKHRHAKRAGSKLRRSSFTLNQPWKFRLARELRQEWTASFRSKSLRSARSHTGLKIATERRQKGEQPLTAADQPDNRQGALEVNTCPAAISSSSVAARLPPSLVFIHPPFGPMRNSKQTMTAHLGLRSSCFASCISA